MSIIEKAANKLGVVPDATSSPLQPVSHAPESMIEAFLVRWLPSFIGDNRAALLTFVDHVYDPVPGDNTT